jgi:hypothetical protein
MPLAERPQGRVAAEVAGLDHDQGVGSGVSEDGLDRRGEVAPGRADPQGPARAEEADRARLVRHPGRIGGEGVAVEADELERVRRVGHEALGRRPRPFGDEPGIGPVEQEHGGAGIEAAQGPLDIRGFDRGHGSCFPSAPPGRERASSCGRPHDGKRARRSPSPQGRVGWGSREARSFHSVLRNGGTVPLSRHGAGAPLPTLPSPVGREAAAATRARTDPILLSRKSTSA